VALGAKGKHKKALELYLELEGMEAKDGDWSRKAGEMYRQMGKEELAIEALGRAASRYTAEGFLVKAVAMCKMILRIDEGHVATQAELVRLNAERGIHAKAPEPEPSAPVLTPAPIPTDVPLDQISMHRTVPGARQREIVGRPSGIIEIPLELELPDEMEVEVEAPEEVTRDALERTPVFSALSPDNLHRLIEQVELVELAAGERLFAQGDTGRTLYVVAEGRISVVTESPERKIIGELRDGDFFGEFAMVTEEPRSASIEALVDSELLAIDRQVMCNLIREEPVVLTVLLRFLRDRLVDNLVQSSPLFAPFAGAEREELVGRFQFLEVEADSELVAQDAPAEALYLVMSGQLSVDRQEDGESRHLATLGPGDLFGEMSLLAHTGAVATVSARSKCLVLELPAKDFRDVIMTHPQVLAFIGDLASERERELAAVAGGEQQYEELHLDLI
jgi:CRP-like cAMP-binding protein